MVAINKNTPVCFNFHESGDLLSYEDQSFRRRTVGKTLLMKVSGLFNEPNEYSVENKTVFIFEVEDCREIEGYYDNRIITACECVLSCNWVLINDMSNESRYLIEDWREIFKRRYRCRSRRR